MSVDVAELVLRVKSLEVKEAKRELRGMRTEGAKTEKGMSFLETRAKSVSRSFSVLKGVIAGGIFSGVARGAILAIDGYKNVNALLNIVSDSSKDFIQTQKELFDVAQNNYASIDATTRLYAGQSKQLEALGYQHTQQINAVDLFSKALATSGANTSEAAAATLQWVQGLGSGILRGQEFNSIMENGRGVAIALADGLGTTIGNLRNMALAGKLSAKTVVDSLLSQEDAIREKFSKIPITIGKAWQQLQNSATVAVSKINDGIGDATGGIANLISSFSRMIDGLDFDRIVVSLKAVSFVIATLLIPTIAKLTIALALNPFFLFATGIAFASVKIYQFADDMVTVGNRTATVADFIGGTWDVIKDYITLAIDIAREKWSTFSDELIDGRSWSDILELAKETLNGLIGGFVSAKDQIASTWKAVPLVFRLIGLKIARGFQEVRFDILSGFAVMAQGIATIFQKILLGVNSALESATESFRPFLSEKLETQLDNASVTLLAKAKEYELAGTNAVKSITNEADATIGALTDKIHGTEDMITTLNDNLTLKQEQNYAVDYLGNAYKALEGVIDDIGKKAETRQFLRETAEEIESLGGNMNDASITADQLAKKKAKLTTESGKLTKAQEQLNKSQDALIEGFNRENQDLDIRLLKLKGNEDAILRLNLANKTFGADNLKFSQQQINDIANRTKNIVLLEKEKKAREQLSKSRKELTDGFKEDTQALDIRLLKLKGNEDAILRLQLASKAFGEDNLKYNAAQIEEIASRSKNITLLEKEKDARDKLNKSYKDELASLKARNFELQNTPTANFEESLRSKGFDDTQRSELSRINSENGAIETFGQIDAEQLRFDEEILRLQTAEQLKLDTVRPYKELRETLELEHQNNLFNIQQEAVARRHNAEIEAFQIATKPYEEFTGGILDILKASGQEQSGVYKAMFEASKAFAIAESIIKIQQGIAQAASLPFPANLGAIGTVVSQTAGIVSKIRGADYVGAFNNGTDFMVAGQGGIDNNRISMDVSRGEQVIVKTPKQQKESGGTPVIYLTIKGGDRDEVNQSENADGSKRVEVFARGIIDTTKSEISQEFIFGGDLQDAVKVAVK